MTSAVTASQSKQSTCGVWWNRDRAHVYTAHKSAAIVMLPCQYGPKFVRNVFSTLLDLGHELKGSSEGKRRSNPLL